MKKMITIACVLLVACTLLAGALVACEHASESELFDEVTVQELVDGATNEDASATDAQSSSAQVEE